MSSHLDVISFIKRKGKFSSPTEQFPFSCFSSKTGFLGQWLLCSSVSWERCSSRKLFPSMIKLWSFKVPQLLMVSSWCSTGSSLFLLEKKRVYWVKQRYVILYLPMSYLQSTMTGKGWGVCWWYAMNMHWCYWYSESMIRWYWFSWSYLTYIHCPGPTIIPPHSLGLQSLSETGVRDKKESEREGNKLSNEILGWTPLYP